MNVDLSDHAVTTDDACGSNSQFRGACGYGCFVRIGLTARRDALFAIFVDQERLYVYADGRIIAFEAGVMSVARTNPFPFVRRFTIYEPGRNDRTAWTYWITDAVEEDILWQIDQIGNDATARETFLRFWEHAASGEDPTDERFQRELGKHLASFSVKAE